MGATPKRASQPVCSSSNSKGITILGKMAWQASHTENRLSGKRKFSAVCFRLSATRCSILSAQSPPLAAESAQRRERAKKIESKEEKKDHSLPTIFRQGHTHRYPPPLTISFACQASIYVSELLLFRSVRFEQELKLRGCVQAWYTSYY